MNYAGLEREEEAVADDLRDGRITLAEYNAAIRDLHRGAAQAEREDQLMRAHNTWSVDEAYDMEYRGGNF